MNELIELLQELIEKINSLENDIGYIDDNIEKIMGKLGIKPDYKE